MFNCSMCKKPSQPGTPATMVVVETRPKVYHNYHHPVTGAFMSTTHGEEIIKEQLVCSSCRPASFNTFNSMQPALEFLQPGVASRVKNESTHVPTQPTYQDYIPDGTP